jgi:hypothetical protein
MVLSIAKTLWTGRGVVTRLSDLVCYKKYVFRPCKIVPTKTGRWIVCKLSCLKPIHDIHPLIKLKKQVERKYQ